MEASDVLELGEINAERDKKLLPLMLEEEYLERKRKDSDITRKRNRITAAATLIIGERLGASRFFMWSHYRLRPLEALSLYWHS